MTADPPPWLTWMRRLQAVADTGQHYSEDPYERKRLDEIRAVAAEIAAARTGEDPEALVPRLADAEAGHPTPKVDVRAAAFRPADGRLLMVQERADGGWTLPGGWADVGEPPAVGAARELREESGYAARAVKVIAVHDRDRHNTPPHPQHIYKLFYLCELLDEPPGTPDDEVLDVGFFALEEVPPLSTGRTSQSQLELAFAHHADPARPTDFD